MVLRNCRGLLTEIHDLEQKIEALSKEFPDLDLDLLLESISEAAEG